MLMFLPSLDVAHPTSQDIFLMSIHDERSVDAGRINSVVDAR